MRIKNGDVIISLEGTADLKKEKMDMQARIEGVNPSPFLKGTGISLEAPRTHTDLRRRTFHGTGCQHHNVLGRHENSGSGLERCHTENPGLAYGGVYGVKKCFRGP